MTRYDLAAGFLLATGLTGLTLADRVIAQTPAQAKPASISQDQPAQPAKAAAPTGNPETGRKLFVAIGCYQCHGYEGQGSSVTGPKVGPRPLPFVAFSRYVRSPTGQMPAYTLKVLPEGDLAHIHAFLQAQPAPPAADSIPLLNQ